MSTSRDDRSVPSPSPNADRISDLPPADASEEASNVKGGVLKTRHDTVKNSIGN